VARGPVSQVRIWLETLTHDVRYGIRALRNQPLGNGIIVLTMALLIGAASVLYGSVRGDRLRYAPFPELETMVQVWRVGEHRTGVLFPPALFREYHEKAGAFEHVGAIQSQGRTTLTGSVNRSVMSSQRICSPSPVLNPLAADARRPG